MDVSLLSKLTEGQKTCLRLVQEGYEAKEIARKLLISPHAVVERLRGARRTLCAQSSREAARLLAHYEDCPAYNRIVDNPIVLEPKEQLPKIIPTLPAHTGLADDASQQLEIREDQMPFTVQFVERSGQFPLPFPTEGRQQNDLNAFQTISMIAVLAVALAFAGIAVLAIVGELTQLYIK
jgi:DNA-binding CsgD family transcriptional regulator